MVFDLGELGTVHPTQQHHRQLAAIAQSHSHSSHNPSSIPHSPALSTMRQSPAPGAARSEREGSASSSIAPPPLFMPHPPPPSSTASSADPVLPTPGEESDAFGFSRTISSESESSTALGPSHTASDDTGTKRPAREAGEGPKKKRRIPLTHLGDGGTT